ncbi:hybrid signal transduction histidine kinase A [Apiospora phragmitis]|uniref:histidine kinase n=1 Tax=Apiospora phragmitis TaxID=2905665 RepID=A0ABR1VXQ1_9PEZI
MYPSSGGGTRLVLVPARDVPGTTKEEHPSSTPSAIPVSTILDLAEHPRYRDCFHVRGAPYHRFYTGVPIRTPKGINIGVFCVYDDRPRDAIDAEHLQVMRDISCAVTDYLESIRATEGLKRSDRMVRGISSFAERESTISQYWLGSMVKPKQPEAQEAVLNANQQSLQDDRQLGGTRTGSSPRPYGLPHPQSPVVSSDDLRDQAVKGIFSKAANIIREAIEVEGVLCLDASISTYGGLVPTNAGDRTAGSSDLDRSGSSDTSGDEAIGAKPIGNEAESRRCPLLGVSTSNASCIDGAATPDQPIISVSEAFLAKLTRRFPNGKTFVFDYKGISLSGESSEDEIRHIAMQESANAPESVSKSALPRRSYDADLHAAFSEARSILFLPLWDFNKDRWVSGIFAWTKSPVRVFTEHGELSYLKAFGTTIMSQLVRLDTALAEKAKSDMLNSISHELRSPLHGILAAVELLGDTPLDSFQGDALHSLGACGRTLLDVIDHLLDFSKINRFTKNAPQLSRDRRNRTMAVGRQRLFQSMQSSLAADIDIAGLIEESVDTMFVGHSYNEISASRAGEWAYGHRRFDASLDPAETKQIYGPKPSGDHIKIYLSISPAHSWRSHTQADLRKNTEKTRKGRSLEQIKLKISDSGRGMSKQFVKHNVFNAFTQEDALDQGTGIGMRLVQHTTQLLGGTVDVMSEPDVGTAVTVTLPLINPSDGESPPDPLNAQVDKLRGLRVRLLGFDKEMDGRGLPGQQPLPEAESMAILCREWLQLELVEGTSDLRADLILCSDGVVGVEEGTIRGSTGVVKPAVVVCQDVMVARYFVKLQKERGQGHVFEFIGMPAGPRKVASSLLLALERWKEQKAISPDFLPLATEPPSSTSSSSGQAQKSHLGAQDVYPQPGVQLLRIGDTPAEMKVESRAPSPASLTRRSERTHDKKILLVDDNRINLQILVAFMKKLKKSYETASNGLEAYEAYKSHPESYCCILMDISMPVMNGLHLSDIVPFPFRRSTLRIRELEKDRALPAAKIIALTGLAGANTQKEAFASGIDVYMTKPAQLKRLSETLAALF